MPVTLLPDASTQEGVVSIRTIIPSEPAQSAVVSEGVATHGASAWHDTGIRGQGVKIGIIDSAFDGFSSLMGTELPSTVLAKCLPAIGVSTSNLAACDSHSKHGTAVTETVLDIAPEATYYIANPLSFGDLQTAVDWMLEQDVDVINMSVNWSWDGSGGGGSPYSDSPLRILNTAVRSESPGLPLQGITLRIHGSVRSRTRILTAGTVTLEATSAMA